MHKQRLLKLAEHLETGKLGHDRFDFEHYHQEESCGYAGCAIGECPILFPRHWRFDQTNDPVLRHRDHSTSTSDAAQSFFKLSEEEESHLFHANFQDPSKFGGRRLGPRATRYQVAANIRAFVEKIEEENMAKV